MSEKQNLILIASGPDQVGLVEKISDFIRTNQCNIEDSNMAVLAGEFVYMVLISGEANHINIVASESKALAAETQLDVLTRRPAVQKNNVPSVPYKLSASCMDHPGVVHMISNALSDRGINIESMETRTYAAPVSGTPIFRMEAMISVPTGVSINELRNEMESIEKQENIDIDLSVL